MLSSRSFDFHQAAHEVTVETHRKTTRLVSTSDLSTVITRIPRCVEEALPASVSFFFAWVLDGNPES